MATPNRAAKITKLVTALKKKFKPAAAPPKDRPLLEHLLLACLLEDSPHDAAEEAFAGLQQGYFDWNEVRVSTKRELSEKLNGLVDPPAAAERLKNTLQSIFESVYSFDLEAMKKQNLGASVKQLEKHRGVSPFVVSYAVQNSLGGHAIPINKGLLIAFEVLEIISPRRGGQAHGAGPRAHRAEEQGRRGRLGAAPAWRRDRSQPLRHESPQAADRLGPDLQGSSAEAARAAEEGPTQANQEGEGGRHKAEAKAKPSEKGAGAQRKRPATKKAAAPKKAAA